jgi:hypothetical protein
MLIINAKRNGYAPDQCGNTMTVGELMCYLEDCNPEDKIYLSHDRGYTYGSITVGDFDEQEVADEDFDEDESPGMTMQ